jgi:hypothetical protein
MPLFAHAALETGPNRSAMVRKRHTREDILLKVGTANAELAKGMPIEQISAELQVNLPTLRRWLREHAGVNGHAAPRVSQLERENRRLRKAIAELEFDKKVLSETLRGNF